jgi:hypothetical protein
LLGLLNGDISGTIPIDGTDAASPLDFRDGIDIGNKSNICLHPAQFAKQIRPKIVLEAVGRLSFALGMSQTGGHHKQQEHLFGWAGAGPRVRNGFRLDSDKSKGLQSRYYWRPGFTNLGGESFFCSLLSCHFSSTGILFYPYLLIKVPKASSSMRRSWYTALRAAM